MTAVAKLGLFRTLSRSPKQSELGGSKDLCFPEIVTHCHEKIHFKAERCKKYRLYRKMLQMKVAGDSISYKKLSGCISPSTPGVELGCSKDWRS